MDMSRSSHPGTAGRRTLRSTSLRHPCRGGNPFIPCRSVGADHVVPAALRDDPGSLNLCFHAVDIAVIRGAALDPAVRHPGGELDYATLLERVAALAGAMRGTGRGRPALVGVLLDDPHDELLAVLATARLGAVVVALDPGDPAACSRPTGRAGGHLATAGPLARHAGSGPSAGTEVEVEARDLAWDLALRAGRTDPAPSAPVAPGDPAYVGADEVAVIDVPGHDSLLGRAVSAWPKRIPLDLTGALRGRRLRRPLALVPARRRRQRSAVRRGTDAPRRGDRRRPDFPRRQRRLQRGPLRRARGMPLRSGG